MEVVEVKRARGVWDMFRKENPWNLPMKRVARLKEEERGI